jgi:hypothetical protein
VQLLRVLLLAASIADTSAGLAEPSDRIAEPFAISANGRWRPANVRRVARTRSLPS